MISDDGIHIGGSTGAARTPLEADVVVGGAGPAGLVAAAQTHAAAQAL